MDFKKGYGKVKATGNAVVGDVKDTLTKLKKKAQEADHKDYSNAGLPGFFDTPFSVGKAAKAGAQLAKKKVVGTLMDRKKEEMGMPQPNPAQVAESQRMLQKMKTLPPLKISASLQKMKPLPKVNMPKFMPARAATAADKSK